ncbi:hypothetical protein [Amylibacter sp. SFDW26]|uniref:hypothetical protein n=1 Tax=Amylibacter sp. SFDW26 TaxID=2652722 RepID=UPI001869F493|nr:hypothetical protein [Amylibacter sp. SFDW26]
MLSLTNIPTYIVWCVLVVASFAGAFTLNWSLAAVAAGTFILTLIPTIFQNKFPIKLPASFVSMIVVFIFATIFLGEAFDFYEQYWWWDVLLHGGSAMGFGLFSFLFVFLLFEGDRYAAPALTITFISFSCAVSIGVAWEILEFTVDTLFGLNMQKSGLQDTMWDLIVDCIGASLSAWCGFFYLKGRELGGFSQLTEEFIQLNKTFIQKMRDRKRLKRDEKDKL